MWLPRLGPCRGADNIFMTESTYGATYKMMIKIHQKNKEEGNDIEKLQDARMAPKPTYTRSKKGTAMFRA